MIDCKAFIAHVRAELGPGADKDERAVFSPKFVLQVIEALDQYDAEVLRLESKLDAATAEAKDLREDRAIDRSSFADMENERDTLRELLKAAESRLHSAIEQIEALKRIMKGIGIVGPEHAWRQLQAVLTEKPESFAGLPEHLQGFAGLPDEHQPKTVVERQEGK